MLGNPIAATWSSGDKLSTIDLTGSNLWFRNASGNWNNDGAANPDTGAGGVDISSVFGSSPGFLVFWTDTTNSSMTLRVSAPFTFTKPTNFVAWSP